MVTYPPNQLMLDLKTPDRGLYESYYFRGNSKCGQYAFWLKHNLLRFNRDRFVHFEATFVFFDLAKKDVQTIKMLDKLTDYEFTSSAFSSGANWDHFEHQFAEDNFQQITPEKVSGKLSKDSSSFTWDLSLVRSNQVYHHFESDGLYRAPFPKKKILTRDTYLQFKGKIKTPSGFEIDTEWTGMNGHNWGSEHAYHYVYADTNQFKAIDAYFDGFSGKLAFAGGLIKSPYLSLCSLRVEEKWFHFNSLVKSFLHQVRKIEDTQWEIIFEGSTHQLEVVINGDPALYPWSVLDYDHPNKKISKILNTKFAHGEFILRERKGKKVIHHLESDFVELETGKIIE